MQQYLIIVALLTCRAGASINRRIKIINDVDNSLEPNAVKSAKPHLFRLNITRSPQPFTMHRPGQPLELSCEAHGAPAPTFRWYRNHNPIYEHGKESNELFTTNPTSLGRISSTILVTKPQDQDTFTCIASNGYTTVKASTTIHTIGLTENTERLKLFPLAPRILTTYYALVDEIGSTIVLPCKAKGHPRPKITWSVNDWTVENNPRMKVLHSGELVISPLRWSDTGKVLCLAENVFGNATAETFLYAAAESA